MGIDLIFLIIEINKIYFNKNARMAESADAPDSKSGLDWCGFKSHYEYQIIFKFFIEKVQRLKK